MARESLKFKVGETLAMETTHPGSGRSLSKVKVSKVRADGKFYIEFIRRGETIVSEQMWTPTFDGAKQSGRSGNYTRTELLKWQPKFDAELHEQTEAWKAKELRGKLRGAVDALKLSVPMDRKTMKDIQELLIERGYKV